MRERERELPNWGVSHCKHNERERESFQFGVCSHCKYNERERASQLRYVHIVALGD